MAEPEPRPLILDMVLGPNRFGRITLPHDCTREDVRHVKRWLKIVRMALTPVAPPPDTETPIETERAG